MLFKNIKEAHEYYNFPGTYRIGSVFVKNYGIIRSYSNGENKDFFRNGIFYYKIKNELLYSRFLMNYKLKNKLRLFVKVVNGVLDLGLVKVKKINKNYVQLKINQ